ncbi:MAG: amino acid adenylation domain-containing protein [Calditrichaeota bacterium]|nr:MAG: amino acid adenylation domain-containing protein [Calditrichota bacterium]MBL1204444.1 amino acid adenylation domain-containing protein [Calditrichota bacterium]NOG44273.1 non-ribosomal peptide synthase/polyketide synthase [Calditrichota bacterium]
MPNEKNYETDEQEVFIFPTSFAQQRLWFLDQFEPGSPFYNIPTAVRITGTLDIPVLEDTIAEIVYRHESLRTTFDTENGDPVQVINPDMEIPLKIIDISNLPDNERDSESLRLANNEARTPFDLKTGPLFRSTLIKLRDKDFVMLVTMHHIISDGWSIGVFMREISVIYSAFSEDKDCPLPDLPIQYADFSSWQREWLSGEVLDKQLNYWKEKLGYNLPILELPTDKPRPAIQSARGASTTIDIPAEIQDGINQLTRKEGITPFMALLSAFYILLYKYSLQEDITVGTPIANRTQTETEVLIGFFINTLVIRADLSGDPTFKEFAQRVRKTTLESYAHQDLPFEMLVEAIQPERSMSHSPLFQVMFILQNATNAAGAGEATPVNPKSDIQMEQITVDAGTSTFDITVSLSEQNDCIKASIEYCTDLFEDETILRFINQYKTVLDSIVKNPDLPLSLLDVLSNDEKKNIVEEWNDTAAEYDYKICMHQLVQKHAQETPDEIAVVAPPLDNDHSEKTTKWPRLTYSELNQRANQLARVLQKNGVKPETPVGIVLEKSLDLAVAVVAVLKAGGGYVPMDPDYPKDRLAHMIEDSNTPLIISHDHLLERIPENKAKNICLDNESGQIVKEDNSNLDIPVLPENMAYMIYTSGTTGKSKGTIVSHQSWVNSYYAWESAYELKTKCRSHLQMANFSFDVFAGDTIRALGSGGKLTLIPRSVLLNADQLFQQMINEKITIAEFVPAVLRNLVAYLDTTHEDLSFMRCLIAGSDAWYVSEYKEFQDYGGPETRLINSFGLTEAAIDSTFFEAAELDLPKDRHVPIGVPFSNMQVYILNEQLMPVPIGVPGEICVGGAGLARGYHQRPDLTAEKFVPHPFSKSGERIYRTGDKGKYLSDGNIEFMGRIDHQVKLRGFRIEMGEIESNLGQHPAIRETVIIVREDNPGDKRLVAYFVPANEEIPDRKDLRTFLLEKLPDYMIPNAFVDLEKIPLTPNGKVDRKSLPQPDESAYGSDEEYIAPRNENEEKVASIWADVLKIEKVGVLNNFFELGGHSLLATQLISRIREGFDLDIPLRNIFEYPTVASLTESIEITQRGQGGVQAPPIMAVSRQQEIPLSFAQQRLWFLDQLEPNTSNYNIPESARIKGQLDPKILEQCLNEIIQRHEVLRTNFVSISGTPQQVIHTNREIVLEQHDVRNLPKTDREAAALKIANQFARTIFNLSEGALLRAGIVYLDDDEFFFLVTVHHIISDDWSTQVFIREIGILYNAFSNNQKSPMPPLPVQYADFSHWQQNWLQGKILEEQLDFWKTTLAGSVPLLELPTDRPRPKVQTFNGSYKTFEIGEEFSRQITNFTTDHGATVFMTLIAAFQTLLYRYSGQDNFNIGTPIANRNRAEIEPLIGFFVNTLVMNADLSGQPTFIELLDRVKETSLNAYAHQDLPFEKIVDALKPDRDMAHSPLFQVMFVLQSANPAQQSNTPQEKSPIEISSIEAHSGTSKFDLTFFLVDDGKNISGAVEYNTDLFDESTIERMTGHFTKLLTALIQQPKMPVTKIALTNEKETQHLTHGLNRFEEKQHFTASTKEIFEKQAAQTPNATAVVAGSMQLKYSELNEVANRLAHKLIEKGIGADDLIGLYFNRSPEMIIAILAVIKSGAAYVPIDPSYPKERINYMIDDSGMKLLLTDNKSNVILNPVPKGKESPQSLNNGILHSVNFTQNAITTMLVDEPENLSENVSNPDVKIDPDSLVYMIYTSGSTGKPKGTLITHGGLTHYLNWAYEAYPLNEGRGSLVHSTIAFDATVTAVFTPILTGKSITLADTDDDLEALAKALLDYQDFNIVKITPAHLDLLSHQIPAEKASKLTSTFVIGGENLVDNQISFWQKNAPETSLFNEYGPTETVVGCVVYNAKGWDGKGSVPIGRSITNSPVYILDEHFQPVPKGTPGELYIAGKGVARGYKNRSDLTAERFLPDPFAVEAGARMYRTGDLVRYLNDDQMIFLGRIDSQVKIRGYRIELGEIESILINLDNLEDAVVDVREDIPGEKRIVAYMVAKDENEIDTKEIREKLKTQLPDYMVPTAFLSLDRIPLTTNGKVDKRALPKPEYSREELQQEFIAPSSAGEEKLAAIWQSILHVDKIGIHDNFFDLGGHSLLATQVMSRVRDEFGVELPLRILFEAPTISSFLLQIEQAELGSNIKIPALVPAERTKEMPLSFSQQRLWFLDQLAPGSANYNIPSAFKIIGSVNLDVMTLAINEIIRRHEVLRTTFGNKDGKPYLIIKDELLYEPEQIDLSEIKPSEREVKVQQLSTQNATDPFDLAEGPLIRVQFLKIAKNETVVLFNMHHIISDGWSTTVLMGEISILYDAFSNRNKSPLPDLDIQYADYAAWQRSWLKDDALDTQINFWKEKLGTNPPVLDLPTDFQRPPVQTFNGDVISIQLSSDITKNINKLARENNSTLFMVLLAAWQTLLHKQSGQDEIFSGSPIANRNYSATEALIGFFVNTLVLRADFDAQICFEDLLKNVREFTLGAYAHQDVPFEQLVDELQNERIMSHSPLFQVMFVLQNTAQQENAPAGNLQIEPLGADAKVSKFDLTLSMIELPDMLAAELEYNTDLFKKETVERMLGHFQVLLEKIVENPQLPLSTISLTSADEIKKITQDWNQTKTPFSDNSCIHHLFENIAEKYASKSAIHFIDGNQSQELTFAELNQRANQLAHYLIEKGVTQETLVGISVERSVEMVVALLGVLKAGGVYVPIDPAYPQERKDYILQDAGIKTLLTKHSVIQSPVLQDKESPKGNNGIHHSASSISPAGESDLRRDQNAIELVYLDDLKLLSQNTNNPEALVQAENMAYMIYTSGSTGKPKGTMVQHRSLCNLTAFQIKDFELNETSRCLQFASFSFDASVSEIFTTLISGATLYLASKDDLMPGPGLIRTLKENKISVVTLPPSVSALLRDEKFPELKTLVSAGEALPVDLANHWHIGRRMLNAYGPTENTVCASSFVIDTNLSGNNVPIGNPIDNVQLYILDNNLQPVPVGIPGELCIGGSSLARGYFGKPDLTAEKFIPNPFVNTEGSRLYRTGDLARFLADGNIEFLGRIDDQVKVRGFRIELGEIENAIIENEAVNDAVVIVREDVPGDKKIAAYFTSGQNEFSGLDLRNYLGDQLPAYMVPSAFVKMDTFPLTANGKIAKRALPQPEYDRSAIKAEFVEPRNENEEKVAAIWKDVLNLEKVGVHDNFFEIGGHSLIATQLVSRIQKEFEIIFELGFIFEAPSIAELSLKIEEARFSQPALETPPVNIVDRSQPIPLSFAQQRLWFLDQLVPNSAMYNLPSVVRLKGNLKTGLLEKTILDLTIRHETLRTTFDMIDGKAVQVISERAGSNLNIIDLENVNEAEREEEALNFAQNEIQQSFDLTTGPLFRTFLVKVSDDDHIFIMNMHHIISDGWSMGILVREIATIYNAHSTGTNARLPQLKFQYADFANWQREWLQGEVYDRQLSYWKNQLTGLPPLINLPLDRPRPAIQTYNGNTLSFNFDSTINESLKNFCRTEGVTSFMTLLAAFQVLLARYSGQTDLAVGTPIANRNNADLEPLIGFFVNTLVIRSDLSDNISFSDLVKQVRTTALGAYANQDIPFETIVDAVAPNREMSYTPLFQVMFVMQNTPEIGAMETSDFSIEPIDGEGTLAKFDLTVTLAESSHGIQGSFEFNTDLFDNTTIERMMGHFETLFSGLLENPQQSVTRIPIISNAEQQEIIKLQNKTPQVFESNRCVHEIFEEQVEKNPDNIALVFEEAKMTYRELNKKSNKLANYLVKIGIKPGDLVGLTVERDLDMVIALIGILKAGAAYVPLDPAYPVERLALILENSQVPLILTQEKLKENLPDNSANIVYLNKVWQEIDKENESNLNLKHDPLNTAYIIYTSGSTGKPKGVMVSHANVGRLFTATEAWYNFDGNDVWTFFHSYAFDFSVWELWGALFYGGRVVIVPYLLSRSPQDFYKLLVKEKVTVLSQTPSAFQQLNHAEEVLGRNDDLALRYIIFGGDTLELQSLRPWFERHGDQKPQLVNMYGITETTVHVTYRPINFNDLDTATGSVIGEPIPDLQIYVLDENLLPSPIGVPGELYVGGAGVAHGYNKQPDLSVERFIPDPFSTNQNQRLYRTGDSARLLQNGDLEYLGRIDHQVQLRGFRVELGEIESALARHPLVRETIVLLREDTPGDKKLTAYVVTEKNEAVSVSEFRKFMQDYVPDYMVPAAFIILEQFPLTAHGKIDRRVLPLPSAERPELENQFEEAQDEIQKTLVDVWSQILNVERIGIHDNFFELGGDSILMIQTIARSKQAGLYMTPTQVFQNPSIAALAKIVTSVEEFEAEQGLVTGQAPLTPIQHWFFDHHQEHPHQFNTSMILELFQKEPINVDVLEKSVLKLMEHHDVLRASFKIEKNTRYQTFENLPEKAPVKYVDLSSFRKGKQKKSIEEEAARIQQSFVLENAPLMKVVFFECGKKANSKLLFIFHHLVIDGVSWRLVIEDFVSIFAQFAEKRDVKLPEKSTSYKKWSEKLSAHVQSEEMEKESAFWKALADKPFTGLPLDKPGGANTYGATKAITMGFGVENTKQLLQEVPKLLNSQINDILLVALLRTVEKFSGLRSALVEMEGHGREDLFEDVDASRTVGWFTSIFPVHLSIENATNIAEEVRLVKEQLAAVPNHGVGFNILKYLSPDKNIRQTLKGLPKAEINFNYLGQFDQGGRQTKQSAKVPFRQSVENVGAEQHPDDERSAQLYIVGVVNGGQLSTRWLYSTNVFKDSTVKKIAKNYLAELETIVNSVIN